MASINDVAHLAKVSTATVSRALSGRGHVSPATLQRVRAAADELGYVVSASASGLASGRTRNIGVVVPLIDHWFYASVLEGISATLLRQGYDTTLYQLSRDPDERRSVFGDFLLRQRVDAVITINVELSADEVAALHKLNKPLVGVGGLISGVPTLYIDDEAVARLATGHLLQLGHRHIAHIGGSIDIDLDFRMPTRRREGYERALTEAGIEVDADLYRGADFTMAGGNAAAKQLLGRPGQRPTAIFAASDEMAIGAILAAKDLGLRVPQDVSVIGVDNHSLAELFGLTTVAQHPYVQGEQAVILLLRAISGTEEVSAHEVDHELIVRSSTARPDQDTDA